MVKATQIKLVFDTIGQELSLIIEDNGKGFKDVSENRGVGLNIMKYRANLIGGTLEVVSKLNQGSKVICKIEAII